VTTTVAAAEKNLDDAREHADENSTQNACIEEVVADKGYHSKAVLLALRTSNVHFRAPARAAALGQPGG